MTFSPPIHTTDLTTGVCISTPAMGGYPRAAKRLQAHLEALLPDPVELIVDSPPDANGQHVIAFGNMMDNPFLRTLYFRAYDLTDRVWPGRGGWVIRTVPHSLEGVGHVIVVGVSDADDIGPAVAELMDRITDAGSLLPVQHHLQAGVRGERFFVEPAQDLLDRGDDDLEQATVGGGSGDWDYMMAIADLGVLGVQTGRVALMESFCRQVCRFVQSRWLERVLQDPPQIHGFLRTLILPFAYLENHPQLPCRLRTDALEALLTIYRSTEGVGNIGLLSQIGLDRVRQNHQTRSALDLYFAGRYFYQVHGLAEGLAWMKLADVLFEPQMRSNKPVCDSWGHQWSASLFNTADYALAAGHTEYFSDPAFLDGVDRALIAHSTLENPPLQYLLMAAAVTGRDEYLQLCRTEDEEDLAERALRRPEEPMRTWVTGRAAGRPERLEGVSCAPLALLFYDSIEEYPGFAPPGIYRCDVPYERTFDKVSLRSGWTSQDDYLLLDGISGGSHSYQDANCIVRLASGGKNWFGAALGNAPASVRSHTGVNVAVDGAGPGCESRFASLDYVGEEDGWCAAGTTLSYPEQADWHRHVVYRRGTWFLVIDEICSRTEGEFLIEGRWNLLGEVESTGEGATVVQGNEQLVLKHAGSGVQELLPLTSKAEGRQWIQRSLRYLREGESVRFATLFWVDRREASFKLVPEGSGFRVLGAESESAVSFDRDAETITCTSEGVVLPMTGDVIDAASSSPFQISSGDLQPDWRASCGAAVTTLEQSTGQIFAGDADGNISAFEPGGRLEWVSQLTGPIRALKALPDGGVVVGGDGEVLYRLDSSGKQIWSFKIEWQPMNWDNWSRKNCALLSLAVGDIGRGRDEILVGCSDRHLYAFDLDGQQLWRAPCRWGPPQQLGLARLEEDAPLRVLAGLADPAIHGHILVHGAHGELLQTLQRPDIVCWSIPSWSTCLRVIDLNDDGREEIISGLDTNHRQLIVYRADGEILWDADLGGAASTVECGDGRAFVGAVNGYVHCFSADGRKHWSRFLAEPVVGLGPSSSGCLVALSSGEVISLDNDGVPNGATAESVGITSTLWTGEELLIGREDGTISAFSATR